MRRVLFGFLTTLVAAGCGTRQVSKDDLDRQPTLTPPPSYSFNGMPYVFQFEQGIHRDYEIFKYAFVERGTPVVTVRNLPEGATFDGRTLSWTPPCGRFPEFYKNDIGIQSVIFTLRSDNGSDDFIERDAGLVVHQFKDYGGQRQCEEIQP